MTDCELLEKLCGSERTIAQLREALSGLREAIEDNASQRVLKAFVGIIGLGMHSVLCDVEDARIALAKRINQEKGELT